MIDDLAIVVAKEAIYQLDEWRSEKTDGSRITAVANGIRQLISSGRGVTTKDIFVWPKCGHIGPAVCAQCSKEPCCDHES